MTLSLSLLPRDVVARRAHGDVLLLWWLWWSRQATIARQVELIDALKELQMQEAETAKDWLSPEYQQILKDADALRNEVKKR